MSPPPSPTHAHTRSVDAAVEAMTALVCASWTVLVPLTNDDVDLVCEAVLHHLQRPHTRMAKCAPLFFGYCNILNTPAGNRTLVSVRGRFFMNSNHCRPGLGVHCVSYPHSACCSTTFWRSC